MRHLRGAVLLVVASIWLAGCAGHRSRPSHAGGTSGTRSTSGARRGHVDDAFHDDIRRDQDSRYRDRSDSVPTGNPLDVSKLVEPTPHWEPRSAYGNKSPYTVLGHTYRVLPSARGYVERGIASFYGNKFHGYKTSSLENYDMYQFSAAHKTLPLPSYARVTNLANGKSVIVRINDRGPFHANRLIDLSYAAAVKIGIWPKGTGMVEVRAIDPAHPDDAPPPVAATAPPAGEPRGANPVPVAGASPSIYLQVGAFSDATNAERLAQRLRAANLGQVQVLQLQSNGQSIRRVRVGPLPDAERADEVARRIEAMGLPAPQVAVD
ncbi:septal ring lytic transglycosylase RlpA family protein [Dyella ginsengisoli]|uniref:Endolytic peptidoglycan transglycosylase RlpA n=1 Tax=Dyella ginsengisoli TaxID=363848 RepID=A0ABW8JTT4_9GAMM